MNGVSALDRTYCVYKHTNRINRKVYIGITSQKPRIRWDSGWGYQRNKHFWDAIQKYGWHSFDHEVLFDGLSPDEAFLKEQELISLYDSCDYRKGYNCSVGGEFGAVGVCGERHHMFGKHHTEETKAKLRAKSTGRVWSEECRIAALNGYSIERRRDVARKTIVGYNKGKSFSAEHKRKIAESNRGQKRSDETRKRVSEAHKIPVLQLTREGEFVREWGSAKEAAEALSIQPGHISKVCKKQRKTAGGFVWQYK